MAIAALKRDHRTVGAAANGLHVNRMVEFDRAGIACRDAGDGTQSRKFGMAVFEAGDVIPRQQLQPLMTKRAFFAADCVENCSTAMLGMTGCAIGWRQIEPRMVDRAVVAVEASAVGGFGGKGAGLLEVAGGAFLFQDGMGAGHAATGVNTMIAREAAPSDPNEREERQERAEPEFGALQRGRPLEIVEVDALGEFFGCACARHRGSK